MKKVNDRYEVFGNPISQGQTRATDRWQAKFVKMFNYDPNEQYTLSTHNNPYLGDIFGLKDILRNGDGQPFRKENSVVVSTIRMGFGHYRIAMAGVSAAKAMGPSTHPSMSFSPPILLRNRDAALTRSIMRPLPRGLGCLSAASTVLSASSAFPSSSAGG